VRIGLKRASRIALAWGRIASLGFFLSLGCLGGVNGESLPLIPRSQGLNTDTNPLLITDWKTQDAQNVRTDESGGIRPRLGFVSFSTQVPDQQWVFYHSNGTRYIIARSSDRIMASQGNSNFTIFIATVDPTQTTAGSALGDRWYFGNNTDVLKYWNSNSVIVTSGSNPKSFSSSLSDWIVWRRKIL